MSDELTVDQHPARFIQLLKEHLNEESGDLTLLTSTNGDQRAAVVIRDAATYNDLAIAWTPHGGLHFDPNPTVTDDGGYRFGGPSESMRSVPGPGETITADFVAMVTINRMLDRRIDAATLDQLGLGRFASELAGRLMIATEGDEFTPDDDLFYVDSFEGFRIAYEPKGENSLAVILDDEDSGEACAVGWSRDRSRFFFGWNPFISDDGYLIDDDDVEFTTMGVETSIREVVDAVLNRMRQRRQPE